MKKLCGNMQGLRAQIALHKTVYINIHVCQVVLCQPAHDTDFYAQDIIKHTSTVPSL
jgi:hypothetical protein